MDEDTMLTVMLVLYAVCLLVMVAVLWYYCGFLFTLTACVVTGALITVKYLAGGYDD